MVKNVGGASNEESFWHKFTEIYGEKALSDKAFFNEFYKNEFQNVKDLCGCDPKAAETIKK